MSVEPSQWLAENASKLGFEIHNVGPASADLRMHSVYKFAKKPSWWQRFKCWFKGVEIEPVWHEVRLFDSERFSFKPGFFYLCSTTEYIRVPDTHCAFVQMRSSLARKGLGHKMAGFIDPGFEGQVTLELETHLPVYATQNDRIVQIIYERLTEKTDRAYKGKYQGQQGPTEAYI